MIEQPLIFTFYSFKGGVGRSMALLNLAYGLVAKGRNVLVLDMDLEAPGLSGFMSREKEIPHFARHDMLDLLQWAKETAPHVSEDAPLDPSSLPPLTDYAVRVSPEKLESLPHKHCELGRLDVIPIEQDRDYYNRLPNVAVTSMDRETLLRVGSLLRSWLKTRRIALDVPDYYGPVSEEDRSAPYDYVLIDSRTGITEVGGLCIGPLSDQLVVLCGLNDQNVVGTRQFLEEVGVLRPQSDTPSTLGKPTLFVASPVPTEELTFKTARLKRLAEALGPIATELTYHPQLALMETIFVRDYTDEVLTFRYWKLLGQLLDRAGERFDFDPRSLAQISSEIPLTQKSRSLLRTLLRSASISEMGLVLFFAVSQFSLESETNEENFRLLDRICRALANDDSTIQFDVLVRWSEVLFRWSQCSTSLELAAQRSAEAINRLDRIIDSPKTSTTRRAEALYNRGLTFGRRNETERAMADYTAVIEMPDAPAQQKAKALVNRGVWFGQRNETEREMADYTAVIEMPDAPAEQKANALCNRGWWFFETSRLNDAIVDCRQAVSLNPKDVDALGNLAIALLAGGQASEALAAYDSAIELANAADLADMEKDLSEAIAKHGLLAGADDVRKRIEARAEKLKESSVPQSAK